MMLRRDSGKDGCREKTTISRDGSQGIKRKFCLTPQPSDHDIKRVENLTGLTIASTPDPVYDTADDVFAEVFASATSPSLPRSEDDGLKLGRLRASTITEGPGADIHPKKLPTVFKWEGGGKNVCISGSFDGWKSKIPLVKSHNDFYTILDLSEGTHQYKFFVDGQWVCDDGKPKCPSSPRPNGSSTSDSQVPNSMGSHNNVINVSSTDFEVFEALAMDSVSTGHSKMGGSGSPPGTYTQEIPPRHPASGGFGFHHSGPPILPPHLLQVILNKETSSHCEPTLLPEPNHVMLNHLYALSIKDGVMVLSATHRYRKKYVTTLLYKPIKP